MPNYYLHRDGQNHGPYSEVQMKQLVASGQVSQGELICPEGGSDWVPASTLVVGSSPRSATGPPAGVPGSLGSRVMAITQEQVSEAYVKIKTPILGMVFSAGLPLMLLAAKSDSERGVRSTGKHRAAKELLKANTDLLPLATVVGIIGVVICAIWFARTFKRAKAMKAELKRQQV
ncbi:MAG: hypothetical protein CFE26_15905 [Verrucomicrobiales bacterium VVV1]|nr:MAG: hypothetical protein CFE26_15905 [Verrucomicrobiales bacterium VVV1]